MPHIRCVTACDTLRYIEIRLDMCGYVRYGWYVSIRRGSTRHASHVMVCSRACVMADAFCAACNGTHTDIRSVVAKGSMHHASHAWHVMVHSHVCVMADAFRATCDGTHTDIRSMITRGSVHHASHVQHAMVRLHVCAMADVFRASRDGTHADIRLNVTIGVTCHARATRDGVITCSCDVQRIPRSTQRRTYGFTLEHRECCMTNMQGLYVPCTTHALCDGAPTRSHGN